MTASSSFCTPLFLKALPQMTGKHFIAMMPLRMVRWSASRLTSCASRYWVQALIVVLGDALEQLVVVLVRLLLERGRDGPRHHPLALLSLEPQRVHLDQVDDALELVL